ncbi:MAG: hypothetical protein HY370_03845 [Proteobacteria bacterium]|nr:hypothetical protein [Pseudomonadota bacterium]
MKVHSLQFSGSILERGFWLYVYRIVQDSRCALYVGRTGDSSSHYASSPFNRLGQHLDMRKASANMLKRNLEKNGFDLLECKFELIAVGPIYEEQNTLKDHRRYRDIVAPLETALAGYLEKKGYKILGSHGRDKPFDRNLFKRIVDEVGHLFPDARLRGHDD